MLTSVPRFKSLSARLTVQFALLFAVVMIAVSASLSTTISGISSRQVEGQLVSSGAVYDRLWQQRSTELQGAARLLARDFGFRAAVATGDQPTMKSALDNAKSRLRVGNAFIVTIDGSVHGLSETEAQDAAQLWDALDQGHHSGIAMVGGKARQLVAAPVMAPALLGWVVFAADLGEPEMQGLESLSAIPLNASVLVRDTHRWRDATRGRFLGDPSMSALIESHSRSSAVFDIQVGGEPAIALAKPLPALSGKGEAVLLLAYPRSQALSTAWRLQAALAAMTVIGLGLVAFGAWRASSKITRPLQRLDDAAGRLATGEHVLVHVDGHDELARLGSSFNEMVVQIEEREKRIAHLAFNDVLTGLPNRTMFQHHLAHLLKGIDDGGSIVALHCLDVDHFKTVNDTMGHPAGDALLVSTAERLTSAARGHFVARLGGDEFVVVQCVEGAREEIDRLAKALLEAVSEPQHIDGQQLVATTSIGIAVAPGDGTDPEELHKSADLALYRAKEAGRGAFAYFEEGLNRRAQERRRLEQDLRLALEQGQFELYYQPLFDLEKNEIGSFEALLRWNHPTRGLISPTDFIPVAEETGLIVPIGCWAIREACRQAAHWPDDIRIAVNVSPVQFHRAGLQETVVQALAASEINPARLEIEITESIFLEGSEETLRILHGLRAIGVRIALDDFGTGYSSLSYLQSFPFDKLKIDRSFIENLLRRPGATAVVRAITELADALGMETTAEGVEENDQLSELRAQGCSSVQGFLFSKPVTAENAQALIDSQQRRAGRDAA
jgi:diguanylate cyclase (GGDEF)-like protein